MASQVLGIVPKFSTFSGGSIQKGEVSFEQWVFKVKSVMQSHTEVTLKEGMVWSLHGAVTDMAQYLGLQAPVSEIVNKLELVYGTMEFFDILIQNFYTLQQGKTEKVTVCVT